MEQFSYSLGNKSFNVQFQNADTYQVSPKISTEKEKQKIEQAIWEKIVAPNGPNFRGRKRKR